MLFLLCLIVTRLSAPSALHLNFYTSVGQLRDEISLRNGYLRAYFTEEEFNTVVP